MSFQRCALALLVGSTLGLTSAPQAAEAAGGIDATVSHRALKDGPVELELHSGEVLQTSPPSVALNNVMGLARLRVNNIANPVEISCQLREANATASSTTPVTVAEHLWKDGELYSTNRVINGDVGKQALLTFITVPDSKGSYVYTIDSVENVELHFVDCTVKTLGGGARSGRLDTARSARASPRGGRSARPAARASRSKTPRISGKRSLTRLSPKAVRKFERAQPQAPRRAQPQTPAPKPSSHSFGALQFASESKKAQIYTAEFVRLGTDGLRISRKGSIIAGISVPVGKSALVDCEIDTSSLNQDGMTIEVKQNGSSAQTFAFDDGTHHLVFGVPRTIGLETITLQSDGYYDFWGLGQCEVKFK